MNKNLALSAESRWSMLVNLLVNSRLNTRYIHNLGRVRKFECFTFQENEIEMRAHAQFDGGAAAFGDAGIHKHCGILHRNDFQQPQLCGRELRRPSEKTRYGRAALLPGALPWRFASRLSRLRSGESPTQTRSPFDPRI